MVIVCSLVVTDLRSAVITNESCDTSHTATADKYKPEVVFIYTFCTTGPQWFYVLKYI